MHNCYRYSTASLGTTETVTLCLCGYCWHNRFGAQTCRGLLARVSNDMRAKAPGDQFYPVAHGGIAARPTRPPSLRAAVAAAWSSVKGSSDFWPANTAPTDQTRVSYYCTTTNTHKTLHAPMVRPLTLQSATSGPHRRFVPQRGRALRDGSPCGVVGRVIVCVRGGGTAGVGKPPAARDEAL